MPFRLLFICVAIAFSVASASPARAQDYDIDPDGSLTAIADIRLTGADGERSWIDGGFGKTRFGSDHDGEFVVEPRIAAGDLVWQPRLGWSVGGIIAVTAQDGQDHPVDLSEAFLTWRHGPHERLKLSARIGLLWPPVSFEHARAEWAVADTITPSAINSWIGEEVKVAGAEATGTVSLGDHRVTGTLGVFGFNDTAGTLLAFRGWALHDVKATAFGEQPLPTLDAFWTDTQAARTRPVIEIDGRPGLYAAIGWSPSPTITLRAFHYDNRGDPEAVTDRLQWGWRTRFTSLGARIDLDAKTRFIGQAMAGRTEMGFPMQGRIWVDTDFRSAFALLTRAVGSGSASGRIEAFETRGGGSVAATADEEKGWAATIAARRPFGEHISLLAELLHVESTRDARLRDGIDPRQTQTLVQIALRVRS